MMLFQRNVGFVAAFGLGLSVLFACSSDKNEAPAGCQDSFCTKNNKCIDNGKTNECRLLCSKQEDCPDKFQCVVGPKSADTFCAPLEGYAAQIVPREKGQWGASCNPSGGLDANADCDSDQGFWCYGQTTTDGEAFCTQYQCGSDAECKGGYHCATVNTTPDVRTDRRSVGATSEVCLPRGYCDSCKVDVDCPTDNGIVQHCVEGNEGEKFCAPVCKNDGNCRMDAACKNVGDYNACMPRAGTCKGDGSLCSPCRNDKDCPNGACITQPYSREKYCAVKSGKACAIVNDKLVADCPSTNAAGADVGCQTTKDDPNIPKDMCIGIVPFGDNSSDGCWSKFRK